jgi:hypothetical protein
MVHLADEVLSDLALAAVHLALRKRISNGTERRHAEEDQPQRPVTEEEEGEARDRQNSRSVTDLPSWTTPAFQARTCRPVRAHVTTEHDVIRNVTESWHRQRESASLDLGLDPPQSLLPQTLWDR